MENCIKPYIFSEPEVLKRKDEFFKDASESNLDTSPNSSIRPILDFVFNQEIEVLNEIRAISKNYDIEQSEGIFLDLEARKIGLIRYNAEKAKLKCRLNIKEAGVLNENIFFHRDKGGLQFRTTKSVQFLSKEESLIIELSAEEKGSKYNFLSKGEILTPEQYIHEIESLEVIEYISLGKDRESDSEFRDRVLKTINSFTIKETSAFYEKMLIEHEELGVKKIKEAYVKNTAHKEINSMEVYLRGVDENEEKEKLEEFAKRAIGELVPPLARVKYIKANEEIVKVKLSINRKLEDKISREKLNKAEDEIKGYFKNIKLGGRYEISEMYKVIGKDIDILSPVQSKALESRDTYFKVEFSEEDQAISSDLGVTKTPDSEDDPASSDLQEQKD